MPPPAPMPPPDSPHGPRPKRRASPAPAPSAHMPPPPKHRRLRAAPPTGDAAELPSALPPAPRPRPDPKRSDRRAGLDQYRERYKQVFPNYRFYLDGFDRHEHNRIAARIESHGAKIEHFFSNVCTHLVTTRHCPPDLPSHTKDREHDKPTKLVPSLDPSALTHIDPNRTRRSALTLTQRPLHDDKSPFEECRGGTVAQALRMNVRVWPRSKLVRILDVFDGQMPSPSKDKPRKERSGRTAEDLRTLLAAEKVVGAASTASASRAAQAQAQHSSSHVHAGTTEDVSAQYSSLTGVYVLVEDATQTHRPVYLEFFDEPTTPDDIPAWPQVYPWTGEGRCPFTRPTSGRKAAVSKNATRTMRIELDEAQVAEVVRASGENAQAAEILAHGGGELGDQSNVTEEDRSMVAAQPASGVSLSHTNTMGPDLAASAASMASTMGARSSLMTTSTALGTENMVPRNPRVEALQKRATVVGPVAGVGVGAGPAAVCSIPGAKSQVRAFMEQRPRDERKTKADPGAKAEDRPGYCENCRVKYDDFDDHIVSRRHRRFARDDKNFKDLDRLLRDVARTPLRGFS